LISLRRSVIKVGGRDGAAICMCARECARLIFLVVNNGALPGFLNPRFTPALLHFHLHVQTDTTQIQTNTQTLTPTKTREHIPMGKIISSTCIASLLPWSLAAFLWHHLHICVLALRVCIVGLCMREIGQCVCLCECVCVRVSVRACVYAVLLSPSLPRFSLLLSFCLAFLSPSKQRLRLS